MSSRFCVATPEGHLLVLHLSACIRRHEAVSQCENEPVRIHKMQASPAPDTNEKTF